MPGHLTFTVELVAFAAAGLALAGSAVPIASAKADYRAVEPVARPASLPSAGSGRTEFQRAEDGLFYVTALVNGRAVRFLVDTGASVVTLTRADAERVGVGGGRASVNATVTTANGRTAMAWARLKRITIAGLEINDVDAAIPHSELPVSLLGQNALGRLGAVTLEGDRLRVRSPSRTY